MTVLGQTLPQPTPTFNANRNFSLSGTVFSNILWRSASEFTLFLADVFPGAADVPATPPTQLYGPPFAHEAWAIGDVDGNGQASVLFLRASGRGITASACGTSRCRRLPCMKGYGRTTSSIPAPASATSTATDAPTFFSGTRGRERSC